MPKNPESWLLVTARHRLIDAARRMKVQDQILNTFKWNELESPTEPTFDAVNFPDDRLKLLFVPILQSMPQFVHH